MFVCKNCHVACNHGDMFCSKCGGQVEEIIVVNEPEIDNRPKGRRIAGKILSGIGLGVSIFGLVWAVIFLFITLVGIGSDFEEIGILMFVYALAFSEFNIAGIVLGNIASSKGDTSGMTSSSKVLGWIGAGIYIFIAFISLIALLSM